MADLQSNNREAWASRIGLILAMAGNAIGLGNFLRFPVQAAQNGGGAFMIPYFVALLLLGIPLMWVEWSIGRRGGYFGYGSAAGAFGTLVKSRGGSIFANYLGALGIAVPIAFAIYYSYIESWTLAYSTFSITGKYFGILDRDNMLNFLQSFQGIKVSEHFASITTALIFYLITLFLNVYVLSRGVAQGIERLAKIAMPTLFVFAIILVIRSWTLGTPDPAKPENSIINGFGYLWNPDFSQITKAKPWLAAAGQIFFTLSIGTGSILTYASYLKRKDDIALTGLSTSITNEFAEVILGGSIAIPVAVAFFGLAETKAIAQGGAFNLGFAAMPVIFQKLPLGHLFGSMWFLLLFFAGITSSVALCSPAMAFLQDQMKLSRQKAALVVGTVMLLCGLPVVFFLGHGFLDEMDFWAGTFGLVVFAMIEVILFAWIFGMKRAWAEIHEGADIRIPGVFKFIIQFITPVYLIGLLLFWGIQDGIPVLLMKGKDAVHQPYLWGARAMMLGLTVVCVILIAHAYKRGTIRHETATD
ncbi:MAG: sodium-dependent transporter [candidate division KSB1 bacterium]|nr:sodium-dependent transporter [candidate division KSB1 bacterium]MDZ7304069.1 sodium-dependent transporter [candidate division KSB1 bacterium]MDZ7313220.1 sodium-dependent transporter [candidate division KSB1 bacterium]